MAFTYLILNLVMLTWVVVLVVRPWKRPSTTWWLTFAIMALLTLVFDSLAIYLGFFHYNETKILGLTLGFAPVEDFFYALVAVLLIPALWKRFAPNKKESQ